MPHFNGETKYNAPFSPGQEVVLRAIFDTLVPALSDEETRELVKGAPMDALVTGPGDPDREVKMKNLEGFAKLSFTQVPGVYEGALRNIALGISSTNRQAFSLLLYALQTSAGTLALTGYPKPFANLSQEQREKSLIFWSKSPFILIRKAYIGFVGIGLQHYYRKADMALGAMGYPKVNPDLTSEDEEQKKRRERAQAQRYKFHFENFNEGESKTFDVVIIGSGSGGGVVAQQLSMAGYSCIVVEKGKYVSADEMVQNEDGGMSNLYENEGVVASEDVSICCFAGSTVGGGTTVNWSCSLKPQHFVRKEWAEKYGLPYYNTNDFASNLEYVCQRMGVSTESIKHNALNRKLIEGAGITGHHWHELPQNTGGHEHSCGSCGFGCPFDEKQGGLVTWLRDAQNNGCKIAESTLVEKILMDKNKRAVGVAISTQAGVKATIRARRAVICCGGSINTPSTLLRSGLGKSNPEIGKHLHLHPANLIVGYYDFETKPWEGAIMTAVSSSMESKDGSGYGGKVEVLSSHPGFLGPWIPWTGGKAHRERMLSYSRSVPLIGIVRDRDGGEVFIDENGISRINYTISPYDAHSALETVIVGAEILLASGAKEIVTVIQGLEPYVPLPNHQGTADAKFVAWKAKARSLGIQPARGILGSAHQMGSCRMGSNPKTSACDGEGRLWGTRNLYVADASLMPTASGVNPMITTMGIAHAVAGFIKQRDGRNDVTFDQARL